MKLKKTLVSILLVFTLAISTTVFVACDDSNDGITDPVDIGSEEFSSILENIIGYTLSNENYDALIRLVGENPEYQQIYLPPEAVGENCLGYFRLADKTTYMPCIWIYLYSTSEAAISAKYFMEQQIKQAEQEQKPVLNCTFTLERNMIILELEENIYDNLKNSVIPSDKLNQTQMNFIKESITSSVNGNYMLNDIIFDSNEQNSDITFQIFTVISDENLQDTFFIPM